MNNVIAHAEEQPSIENIDLLSVYQLAKKNDAIFQQAFANYRAQIEGRKQAKAAVLPNITLNGTKSETEISSNTAANIDSDRSRYSADLTQPLFDYRLFKGIKQAKSLKQQAEVNYLNAQQLLILRTAETYFNLLSAQDNLRFATAEKDSVKQQLEQSKQRFDVGLIAITDYKEAQANYDLSIANEIQAENTLQIAKEALFVITNQNISGVTTLDANFPLAPIEPQNVQQWVDKALQHNPTLLSAKHQADASRHAIGVTRGDRFPSLNFTASRSYTEDTILSPNGEYDTTLAINLRVPLFEGGGGNSRTRQARYNYDAAYQAFIQQKRLTIQQTRDAYQNLQASISRSQAFAKALSSTKAALEATEAGYQAGTRTPVDVLNALRNVYQSESNYANARYAYITNRLTLLATNGSLSEESLQMINTWLK